MWWADLPLFLQEHVAAALDNMTVCPRTLEHARHLRPALEAVFAADLLQMENSDMRQACNLEVDNKINFIGRGGAARLGPRKRKVA